MVYRRRQLSPNPIRNSRRRWQNIPFSSRNAKSFIEREYRFRQRIVRPTDIQLNIPKRTIWKYSKGFRIIDPETVELKKKKKNSQCILLFCGGIPFRYVKSVEIPFKYWTISMHRDFCTESLGGFEPQTLVKEERWLFFETQHSRCEIVLSGNAYYIDYEVERPGKPSTREFDKIRRNFDFVAVPTFYKVSRPLRNKFGKANISSSLVTARKLDGTFGNLTIVSTKEAVCVNEDLCIQKFPGVYQPEYVGLKLDCECVPFPIILDISESFNIVKKNSFFYTEQLPEMCARLGFACQQYYETNKIPTHLVHEQYCESDGSTVFFDGKSWCKNKKMETVELRATTKGNMESENGHIFEPDAKDVIPNKIYECSLWFHIHPLLAMAMTWLKNPGACSVLRQRSDRFFPNHVDLEIRV